MLVRVPTRAASRLDSPRRRRRPLQFRRRRCRPRDIAGDAVALHHRLVRLLRVRFRYRRRGSNDVHCRYYSERETTMDRPSDTHTMTNMKSRMKK